MIRVTSRHLRWVCRVGLALIPAFPSRADAGGRTDALAEQVQVLQAECRAARAETPIVLVGISGADAEAIAKAVRDATDPSTVRVVVLDPAMDPSAALDAAMSAAGIADGVLARVPDRRTMAIRRLGGCGPPPVEESTEEAPAPPVRKGPPALVPVAVTLVDGQVLYGEIAAETLAAWTPGQPLTLAVKPSVPGGEPGSVTLDAGAVRAVGPSKAPSPITHPPALPAADQLFAYAGVSGTSGVTPSAFLPIGALAEMGLATPFLTATVDVSGGPTWYPRFDFPYAWIIGVEGYLGVLDARKGRGIGPAVTISRLWDVGFAWPWHSGAVGVMWGRRLLGVQGAADVSRFWGFFGIGAGDCDGPACDTPSAGFQLHLEWLHDGGLSIRADVSAPQAQVTFALGWTWGAGVAR